MFSLRHIIESSPFFSKSSMFSFTELPPTSKPHLSDGWWSDSCENTANIWPASSLVGATTRDPISCFRKGVSLLKRISKMGIPKAIVLPDPVVASTQTSCENELSYDLREESGVNSALWHNLHIAANGMVVCRNITLKSSTTLGKNEYRLESFKRVEMATVQDSHVPE